jgi:hypothetical protein
MPLHHDFSIVGRVRLERITHEILRVPVLDGIEKSREDGRTGMNGNRCRKSASFFGGFTLVKCHSRM